MIKTFTLIMLLTQPMLQTCDEGCLRCSPENECIFCDIAQFFYFDTETQQCQKRQQNKCLFIDLLGDCVFCQGGFYVEPTTKECTEVGGQNIQNNSQCGIWDSQQNCVSCSHHHVFVGSVCEPVTTIVPNCSGYQNKLLCRECDTKYTLVNNACEPLPSAPNCMNYSDFQCLNCRDHYFLNTNLSLKDFGDLDTTEQRNLANNLIQGFSMGTENLQNYRVCELILILNCKELTDFKSCNVCDNGYYFTPDQLCKKNPVAHTLNCSTYTSNTTCTSCNEGFYLKNSKECVSVGNIDKCAKHDRQASNSQCIQCQSGYYLLTSQVCKERSFKEIGQCALLNINSDTCFACHEGYVGVGTTQNYSACLPKIDFCDDHLIVGITVTCNGCIDTYHLDSQKQCIQGQIDFCLVYNQGQTSDICEICENKYRLASNACVLQATIPVCFIYDNRRINFCNQCETGFFSVRLKNHCNGTVFSTVPNCKTYNPLTLSHSQCKECHDTFFLTNTNQCQQSLISNCNLSEVNDTNCLECKEGYARVKVGVSENYTCQEPLTGIQTNCESLDFDGTDNANEVECDICKVGSYGYPTAMHFVCVKNERIETLFKDFTLADNCASYLYGEGDDVRLLDEDEAVIVTCNRCRDGYLLDNLGSCLEICPSTRYRQAFVFAEMNSYFAFGENGCIDSGEDANSDFIEFKAPAIQLKEDDDDPLALKCKDTAFPTQVSDKSTNVNPNSQSNATDWVLKLGDVFNEVKCVEIGEGLYVNDIEDKTTEMPQNCELLKAYDGPGESIFYMCVRCSRFRSGIIEYGHFGFGFLNCQTVDNCDSVVYGFMQRHWNNYLGCHKCKGQNEVVVLAVYTGDYNMFDGYVEYQNEDSQISMELSVDDDQVSLPAERCVEHSLLAFQQAIGTQSTNIYLIAGCGMYVLNTGYGSASGFYNNSDEEGDVNLVCGFCKPGFKPDREIRTTRRLLNGGPSELPWTYSCTKIPNCNENSQDKWVDNCAECEVGYSWKYEYDENFMNHTNYQECVPSGNNPNCHAWDVTALEGEGGCVFCKKGYTLNPDNQCEIVQAPHCKQNRYLNDIMPIIIDFRVAMYARSHLRGCSECENGYSAILHNPEAVNLPSFMCLTTDYTNSTRSYPRLSKSVYIQNCLNYNTQVEGTGGSNVLIANKYRQCEICAPGFILTEDKRECLASSTHQNCDIAMDRGETQGCYKCKELYGRILSHQLTYICVENTIANCAKPNYRDNNLSELECLECADTYYYDTVRRKCEEGKVLHCKVHPDNNGDECITCQDNYILVEHALLSSDASELNGPALSVERDYCVQIPSELACSTGAISKYDNTEKVGYPEFSCATCTEIYKQPLDRIMPQSSSDPNDNQCFQHNPVNNCEDYLVHELLKSSNYSCKKCATGYYRVRLGYGCEFRKYQPVNCKVYDLSADKCLECQNNSFISVNGQECTEYPDGVINCSAYEVIANNRVCTACDTTKSLLSSFQCVLVESRDPNCAVVRSEGECEVCKQGYFLNPAGKDLLLNHCEEAIDQTRCLMLNSTTSCQICEFGYRKETNSQGNDVCIDIADVHCLIFDDKEHCLRCVQNYYPNKETVHYTCKSVQEKFIPGCLTNDTLETCELCDDDTALNRDRTECKNKGSFDPNCLVQVEQQERVCSFCRPGFWFVDGVCTSQNGPEGCFLVNPDGDCSLCKSGYHMLNDLFCHENSIHVVLPEGVFLRKVLFVFVVVFM